LRHFTDKRARSSQTVFNAGGTRNPQDIDDDDGVTSAPLPNTLRKHFSCSKPWLHQSEVNFLDQARSIFAGVYGTGGVSSANEVYLRHSQRSPNSWPNPQKCTPAFVKPVDIEKGSNGSSIICNANALESTLQHSTIPLPAAFLSWASDLMISCWSPCEKRQSLPRCTRR